MRRIYFLKPMLTSEGKNFYMDLVIDTTSWKIGFDWNTVKSENGNGFVIWCLCAGLHFGWLKELPE